MSSGILFCVSHLWTKPNAAIMGKSICKCSMCNIFEMQLSTVPHTLIIDGARGYVHLYVEKFDSYEKILLLDFVLEEFSSFVHQLDYLIYNQQSTAFMILFEKLPVDPKCYPKEGSVYRIPISIFLTCRLVQTSSCPDIEFSG